MNKTTLSTLGMIGPTALTVKNIDQFITGRSPGNYALGYVLGHSFIVKYIGRSDTDLNISLKSWINSYAYFKWSYASSELEAYEKECANFHDFGGSEMLDNHDHPSKPKGSKWVCPVCGN